MRRRQCDHRKRMPQFVSLVGCYRPAGRSGLAYQEVDPRELDHGSEHRARDPRSESPDLIDKVLGGPTMDGIELERVTAAAHDRHGVLYGQADSVAMSVGHGIDGHGIIVCEFCICGNRMPTAVSAWQPPHPRAGGTERTASRTT